MALEEIGAPTRLEVAWETIPATGTGSSTYCEEDLDDDGKDSYEPSVTVSWRDAAGVRRTTIEHLDPELSYVDITLWTDLETGDQVHGNLDDLLLLRNGVWFPWWLYRDMERDGDETYVLLVTEMNTCHGGARTVEMARFPKGARRIGTMACLDPESSEVAAALAGHEVQGVAYQRSGRIRVRLASIDGSVQGRIRPSDAAAIAQLDTVLIWIDSVYTDPRECRARGLNYMNWLHRRVRMEVRGRVSRYARLSLGFDDHYARFLGLGDSYGRQQWTIDIDADGARAVGDESGDGMIDRLLRGCPVPVTNEVARS